MDNICHTVARNFFLSYCYKIIFILFEILTLTIFSFWEQHSASRLRCANHTEFQVSPLAVR